jgi:choline dehydrogenase
VSCDCNLPIPWSHPIVDLGFFTDPDDLPRFRAGMRLARRLARTQPLASLVIEEQFPGPDTSDESDDLAHPVRKQVRTYNHGAGTCRRDQYRSCRQFRPVTLISLR